MGSMNTRPYLGKAKGPDGKPLKGKPLNKMTPEEKGILFAERLSNPNVSESARNVTSDNYTRALQDGTAAIPVSGDYAKAGPKTKPPGQKQDSGMIKYAAIAAAAAVAYKWVL